MATMKNKKEPIATFKSEEALKDFMGKYEPTFWEKYFLWPIEHQWGEISYFFRHIYYFYQRGRHGWSNEDTWDLGYYLCDVISGSVKELRGYTYGYPSEGGMTFKKWKEILKDIEVGFKAGGQLWDYTKPERKQKQLQKKFDKGMKLFSQYIFNLWD